jgi:hypothetical protein
VEHDERIDAQAMASRAWLSSGREVFMSDMVVMKKGVSLKSHTSGGSWRFF